MSGRRREGTMKKKLLGLVTCAATLALSGALLAGCAGSGSNDKAADNNAVSTDKTTLTVGFDQSYPPYGFVGDDGKYTGFDLDLAKAVCDKNGWSFEATPIDWDAKDALLATSTASGTASPWKAARMGIHSPIRTCSTSRWWL